MKAGEKGFTLIEILFAILIGLILISVCYIAMTSGQQTSAGVERKVAAQQDVRAAMQVMGLELSMASYNPHYMPNIWHDLPSLGNLVQCQGSGNQAYKGIREATPTAITVEMDVGESNLVGDERGEIIRYAYDPENQYLTRETANCNQTRNASAAAPFLGDNPNAIARRPRTVRVNNQNPGNPAQNIVNPQGYVAVFRYFDAHHPAMELFPTLADPSPIPNIRRIDITLAVETDEVDPASKRRRQMIYSTTVLVRNHVF
jgi:prepilin-type N-terminal cleavage/methylation domain-containing protein